MPEKIKINSLQEFIRHYPVLTETEVIWGDMDAMQHVNNTVYFRYFERNRFDMIRRCGMWDYQNEFNIGGILADINCKYIFPLTYPDDIVIGGRIISLHEDRFVMGHGVYSKGHDRLAAVGEGVLVCYDYGKLSRTPIPGDLRERLQTLLP